MEYRPPTRKFVAVLNKKIPTGNLMNALGHATAGLAWSYSNKAEMRFGDYTDKDGNQHTNISDNPFIVLQADNSNKLRTLREALVEAGIHYVDFVNTMTIGNYAEQKERTSQTPEAELEYWGVVMFGDTQKLALLTKKFSLWRS